MNWWLYADGAATRLQGSGPSHLESLRLQLPIFKLEPSHESAHAAPPPMSIQEVNYLLHAVEVKIPIGPLPEYVLPYVRVASVVDHHQRLCIGPVGPVRNALHVEALRIVLVLFVGTRRLLGGFGWLGGLGLCM